jgi:hypothetical protein
MTTSVQSSMLKAMQGVQFSSWDNCSGKLSSPQFKLEKLVDKQSGQTQYCVFWRSSQEFIASSLDYNELASALVDALEFDIDLFLEDFSQSQD